MTKVNNVDLSLAGTYFPTVGRVIFSNFVTLEVFFLFSHASNKKLFRTRNLFDSLSHSRGERKAARSQSHPHSEGNLGSHEAVPILLALPHFSPHSSRGNEKFIDDFPFRALFLGASAALQLLLTCLIEITL